MILIDTDVLIWDTRGHPQAKARLAAISPWRISTITYIELAQGCRDSAELQRLKHGLDRHRTEILPITAEISRRAMELIGYPRPLDRPAPCRCPHRRHRTRASVHATHRQHQTLQPHR